jgi:hypothetical protein
MSRTVTLKQWRKEGLERFGPDPLAWIVVCPECGRAQSLRDFQNASAPIEVAQKIFAYSCVFRYNKSCDYMGIYGLNPVTITGENGDQEDYFEWSMKTIS